MIRTIINDDEKWRNILRGLNKTFYHKTVTYDDITGYITKESGKDLLPVFDQYLRTTQIPVIEFSTIQGQLNAKWNANAPGFAMPLRVRIKGGEWQFIQPGKDFTPVNIAGATKDNIEVDTFNYYVGMKMD
jgi:aminopeptidase N